VTQRTRPTSPSPLPLRERIIFRSEGGEKWVRGRGAPSIETQQTPHPFFAPRKMSSPARGEEVCHASWWFGPTLLQMPPNVLGNTVLVQQQIDIPIPQDAIPLRLQPTRTLLVIRDLLKMLTAIKLNDQLAFKTEKIRKIPSHRHLPPKLKPIHPPRPQHPPHRALSISLRTSQRTRTLRILRRSIRKVHKTKTTTTPTNVNPRPASPPPLRERIIFRSEGGEKWGGVAAPPALKLSRPLTHFSLREK